MIIRLLLLAGLAATGWFVFLRRNRMPYHIVLVFLLLAAGAAAVISPDLTQEIAEAVGVGRGADLVMYISIVGILFVLVHYYSKFVELQRNVTHLVRELAILRTENEQARAAAPTSPTPTGTGRHERPAASDAS